MRINEITGTLLHHVTLTSHVGKIKKQGITPMNPTNWVKGDGERYGGGEIFAMDDFVDAVSWALKFDWDKFQGMGTGKISIVSFSDDSSGWEIDDADPMSQSGNDGRWLKKMGSIKPQAIKSVKAVNQSALALLKKRNDQRFA